MLNLGCGQYLRNPFFQDFGVKSGDAGCVSLQIIHGCIRYIKSHLELQRDITPIEFAPSPYFFLGGYHLLQL